MNSLDSYLFISSMLFCLGLFGVITRRNAIAVLMGVELILNAANINFVAFSKFIGMNLDGHIFASASCFAFISAKPSLARFLANRYIKSLLSGSEYS